MLRRILLLVLAATVFGLVACCAQAAKTPYCIGAIFTTTGDNAPLGVPERETVDMLAKQINASGGINGHPLKIIAYDDAGKPEQAVRACQDLLSNKSVLAIIGPTLTGPSLAIANMCEKAKMPLLSCAASIKIVDPVKPYVFKTAQSDYMAVQKLVDYVKKSNIKTVAFINDANAYGSSGREEWLKLSKPAKIQTVSMESFNTADPDMTAQLTKIRATNPQAVICWGTNPGPAIVAKNMRTLGMKQPLLMSHGIANMEFIRLAGKAADGVILPAGKLTVASFMPKSDPQRAKLLKYSTDFQKAYGKPANSFGGYAQDSLMLAVSAIKAVGPNRVKIRSRIESTKGFAGVSGVFNMSQKDHNGLSKEAFALVTIKNGKWALIK